MKCELDEPVSFDSSLWLHEELPPYLMSTQPSIDALINRHKMLCTLKFMILTEL